MAVKKRKPRNPSLRFQSFIDTSDLTKKKPERSLVCGLTKSGGRNAYGRITVRHRGGGARRLYRMIDFGRMVRDIPGTVVALEYDPNRTAHIALVVYESGAKRYILAPQGLRVGDRVQAGVDVDAKLGNSLPLRSIPVGFFVHNVEVRPGSGGTFARSAGASAQLVAKEGDYATLKMPSGEVRKVSVDCFATIGAIGNADIKNISLGKAGRSRHLGRRPTVRGMAMNPVDHPHGGGEGRSKSGSHPVSPWGKGCKGTRTRRRKHSDALIVTRRHGKR